MSWISVFSMGIQVFNLFAQTRKYTIGYIYPNIILHECLLSHSKRPKSSSFNVMLLILFTVNSTCELS